MPARVKLNPTPEKTPEPEQKLIAPAKGKKSTEPKVSLTTMPPVQSTTPAIPSKIGGIKPPAEVYEWRGQKLKRQELHLRTLSRFVTTLHEGSNEEPQPIVLMLECVTPMPGSVPCDYSWRAALCIGSMVRIETREAMGYAGPKKALAALMGRLNILTDVVSTFLQGRE